MILVILLCIILVFSPLLVNGYNSIGVFVLAHLTYYNPELLGDNCYIDSNGICISNGESWEDFIDSDSVLACPIEYEFGTVFIINSKPYICKDRGELVITREDGSINLDILSRNVYDGIIEVEVR
jgi:hypothetical protein